MKRKIIVKAPILSRSGYGEQSRIVLRALRSREDLFDIYMMNIKWGSTTSVTFLENNEFEWIIETIQKTQAYAQEGGQFDMSLQITIPNEFEKMAPINIGHTAGIETTRVAPEWIGKTNEMVDRIITISEHAAKGLRETTYTAQNNETGQSIENWGITKPIDVVNYPIYKYEPEEVDINLTTDQNFLVVSQWGPRKNLDNTIRWFIEEYSDDETVGLILKTNTAADSIVDREHTAARLKALVASCGEKKCKVYLLHGELSPGELTWLYQHPTMRALINIAHGEGYGLPLFEAAYNGLPLVTITWGGQMDFICKPNKKGKRVPHVARVDYNLEPVPGHMLWPGVIVEGAQWAVAKEASYKRALRDILMKETHYKQQAANLQKHIQKNFTEEKINEQLVEILFPTEEVDLANQIEEMFSDLSL